MKISKIDRETTALGMGCWAIGGEWEFDGYSAGWGKTVDAESIKTIHGAYDNGIRVFDTAATYDAGLSEELLGKALKDRRDECVISTKIGYNLIKGTKNVVEYTTPKEVINNLVKDTDESLKRLAMDYIDVLFLHVGDYNKEYAPELMDNLENMVKTGKIKSYGWSTDSVDLAKLWDNGQNYSSIQINYNLTVEAEAMKRLASETDLTIFNRGPLAMGFLTGKYNRDSKFPSTDVRSAKWVDDCMKDPVLNKLDDLREVLTSGGRTLTQGALAWIWASNERMLPIPGMRNVKQAEENAKAMEFGPLSPVEFKQVEEIMGRV